MLLSPASLARVFWLRKSSSPLGRPRASYIVVGQKTPGRKLCETEQGRGETFAALLLLPSRRRRREERRREAVVPAKGGGSGGGVGPRRQPRAGGPSAGTPTFSPCLLQAAAEEERGDRTSIAAHLIVKMYLAATNVAVKFIGFQNLQRGSPPLEANLPPARENQQQGTLSYVEKHW
ncbi:hypothetical protein Taro_041814 [Colocasia esculenta]|uniref:Uncharacterized protein n=1 Tax=Colocasia esculenta TaxID=4460 RepID=A0A843WMS2_COLES|nr:hypothetical protein [Colocasia esculenta]